MGTGYVGLTVGIGFAELGNEVICYDNDAKKIQRLQEGYHPIFEENMAELFQKNRCSILFTDDLPSVVNQISVIIMTIGTPSKENGDADTTDLFWATEQLGHLLTKSVLIINKCTAPPGTTHELQTRLNQTIQSRGLDFRCRVAFNPEFLREGRALRDFFQPDRIVLGIDGDREIPEVQTLFTPFAEQHTPIIYTQTRTAELVKYVNNAVAALKVSFINEIANICEQESVNVWELVEILIYDKRISPQYLSPGIGFGGSCLPKDTRALEWIAKKANVTTGLINQILETNRRQIEMAVNAIQATYPKGQLTILGTAFKAGTNDTRESPSIHVIKALASTGKTVCCALGGVRVGGEQIHGGEVGRGVPPGAVALSGFHGLHTLPVALVQPQGTVKQPDSGTQFGPQTGVRGKAVQQGLLIANDTGLDALRQPGTDLPGAATLFLVVFGAKFTFHILHLIFEVSGLTHWVDCSPFPDMKKRTENIPARCLSDMNF